MDRLRTLLPKILITTGVILILVACLLIVLNIIDDHRAGKNAQEVLNRIDLDSEWDWAITVEAEETDFSVITVEPSSRPIASESALITPNEPPTQETPVEEETPTDDDLGDSESDTSSSGSGSGGGYKTYEIIGLIEIPTLGLKLPVIGECSNALLKISCCRIAGRATDKPRRLIIAGHNLKSHFAGLVNLENGDIMTYTMPDGTVYRYAVVDMIGVHKTQVEDVQGGEGWDITLITCKKDNTYRTVVRLAEIE